MTTGELQTAPAAMSVDTLRAVFPLLRDVAYFQTGSLAPLASPVRAAVIEMLDAEGDHGLAGPDAFRALHQNVAGHRAEVAAFLGVEPRELGWTINTTSAIRFAIGSIGWQPGDRLLTTDHEHISTRSLQTGLIDRLGVETTVVQVGESDDRFLSELESALARDASIRLFLISHISCQDGRRLPVEEATRLAHAWDVPVLVDGAQSLGQFPVNLRALGCDMLVGSGHKWLLGPAGLAFLYVSNQGLLPFDSRFVLAPMNGAAADAPLSSRMEIGTQGMTGHAGLRASIQLLEQVGLTQVQRHVQALTNGFRERLAALPGVSILTPVAERQRSGITSFTIEGCGSPDYQALLAHLWETERVVAKVQVEQPSVRISIAAFNNADDVERLTRGIATWRAKQGVL